MTMSERPGGGMPAEDQSSKAQSSEANLRLIKRFIDLDPAVEQFRQASLDAQSIIENNRLREYFGLTDPENPIQEQALGMLEYSLIEQILLNKLGADENSRDSDNQTYAVSAALGIVVRVNKEELDLLPKLESIDTAVKGLFRVVKDRTGRPIDPRIPIRSTILAGWAKKYKLRTV